ncbi:hypothetical protein HYV84_08275 [Candidatus Woesearchaeota archaeon]|nr:hypothetical protein [Candidatus Woesearchaeota archaeon]
MEHSGIGEIEEEHSHKAAKDTFGNITLLLLAIGIGLLILNSYQIGKLKTGPVGGVGGSGISGAGTTGPMSGVSGAAVAIASGGGAVELEGIDVTPKGIPDIYGKELSVAFDDISINDPQKADRTIKQLGQLDRQISLSGEGKERYIQIASQISCEYCCGAPAIIFQDGEAACGCAHSYAMRGLAKYLIKNHPNEYTNEEILEEMGKWKVLFFPGVHAQKAAVLKAKGIELSFVNLASNKYRGAEKGAQAAEQSGRGGTGAMVGGC